MNYLLDTNVLSEIRRGKQAHPSVRAWAARQPSRLLYTSVLVIGEIRSGIERRRSRDPFQAEVFEKWLTVVKQGFGDRVLPVDQATAELWGRLDALRSLSTVDGLLAATAIVHGLTLVTRNLRDVADTGAPLLDPFEAP